MRGGGVSFLLCLSVHCLLSVKSKIRLSRKYRVKLEVSSTDYQRHTQRSWTLQTGNSM